MFAPMTFTLLLLLVSLAGPVFAAEPSARSPLGGWAIAGCWLVGVAWLWTRPLPDAATLATVVACASALSLVRPGAALTLVRVPSAAIAAGASSAALATLLRTHGMPHAPALLASVLPVGASWLLSRGHDLFAPTSIVEEGLLLILVVALLAAVVPGLADGWQSATILNTAEHSTTEGPRLWMWGLSASALVAGALRATWRRL
jgi:hypothetical protein